MPRTKSKNETVAVLGYGSQGRAIALNLRDSGYPVIIGLKSRSATRKLAAHDGLSNIATIGQAIRSASIIVFALPDHLHGRIFDKEIRKNLKDGATLVFLHGFSIHFGFISPPENCDIIMVAPHGPGLSVRQKYLSDRSLSAFYAAHQDYSGMALKKARTLAQAIGIAGNGLVKTTFEHETVGDLFGEQAILCGGLTELVLSGFDLLVKKGIPPENAYLEVAYQLDLIIHLIKTYGIEGMYDRISVTARYGSVMSGKRIVDKGVKKNMEKLYEEIASGKFARCLNGLSQKDISRLRKQIKSRVAPSFEKAALKHAK
ncbi:MAG: ketol-acid reductoisomerase [Candidatus Zixiibacteriota bacterium]